MVDPPAIVAAFGVCKVPASPKFAIGRARETLLERRKECAELKSPKHAHELHEKRSECNMAKMEKQQKKGGSLKQ